MKIYKVDVTLKNEKMITRIHGYQFERDWLDTVSFFLYGNLLEIMNDVCIIETKLCSSFRDLIEDPADFFRPFRPFANEVKWILNGQSYSTFHSFLVDFSRLFKTLK